MTRVHQPCSRLQCRTRAIPVDAKECSEHARVLAKMLVQLGPKARGYDLRWATIPAA
jgi:hypothetical protein